MAPSLRFLLPVSLLILFLALVVAAKAPLSNKHTLQTEDDSEGNSFEPDSIEGPDADSGRSFEDERGDEERDDEEDGEEDEDEPPFQKKVIEVERTSAQELAG